MMLYSLEALLGKPRGFKKSVYINGIPPRKKMIILTHLPMSVLIDESKNVKHFKDNRKERF
jgi:hypothetical protein